MKDITLAIIGLGKLGLCTAACFAHAGYRVIGFDIKKHYIELLKKTYKAPFFEPNLNDLLQEAKSNLLFCNDIKEVATRASVFFIIVPTPSKDDGSFSNKYITDVFRLLTPILKDRKDFFIINVVSTVMPTSGESQLIPMLEDMTYKKVKKDFGYIYNPEFIAIGSVIKDFLNPDLVLIGESDKRSGDVIEGIYKQVCKNTPYIARTSIINAEAAKLCINCFCTMKISFANFLAELLDNVPGASAKEVTSIIGKDTRIGEKYISPGLGFGGPCFPRDNEAFIRFANNYGKDAKLQKSVVEINNSQLHRAVEKINREIKNINPKRPVVALLGLAYKPFTYLTERSQQFEIAKNILTNDHLKELRVFDPYVKEDYGFNKSKTLEECVENADVVVILTPYPEFLDIHAWQHLMNSKGKIINFWG